MANPTYFPDPHREIDSMTTGDYQPDVDSRIPR